MTFLRIWSGVVRWNVTLKMICLLHLFPVSEQIVAGKFKPNPSKINVGHQGKATQVDKVKLQFNLKLA